MSFGQVLKVGEPLPDPSKRRVVYSDKIAIRRVETTDGLKFVPEFERPATNEFDILIRKALSEAIANIAPETLESKL